MSIGSASALYPKNVEANGNQRSIRSVCGGDRSVRGARKSGGKKTAPLLFIASGFATARHARRRSSIFRVSNHRATAQ